MPVTSTTDRLSDLYRLRDAVDAEIRGLEAAARRAPQTRRSRYERPDCGTEQGYQWHRYRRHDLTGDPCGCLAAHRAYNRANDRRRRRRSRILQVAS